MRQIKPKPLRSTLLENARAFASLARPTPKDAEKFRELFYTLVVKQKPAELEELSRILANVADTPRPIALYLAKEDLDIASPVLLL